MNKRARTQRKSGFSLVEVSLAMLVIGIGMLGVMALMPTGLDQNQIAIDDTVCAMFAQDVFNSLRSQALFPDAPYGKPWSNLDDLIVDAVAPDVWENFGADAEVRVTDGFNLVVYKSRSAPIEDVAIQCKLEIGDVAANLKYFRLDVIPRQYGTNDVRTFYTEIYNTTGL